MDDLRDRLRTTPRGSSSAPVSRPVQSVRRQQPRPPVPAQPVDDSSHIDIESAWNAPEQTQPKPKKSKKGLIITLVAILLLGIAGGVYWYVTNKPTTTTRSDPYSFGGGTARQAPAVTTQPEVAASQSTLRFVATGDMIAHDSVNQNARKEDGSYDYAPLMAGMKPFFDKADISFCNQSTPAGGEEFGLSGFPVFNAPVAFARGIEAVGCNVINLGTNHTNDKGQPLVDATAAAWDNRPSVLAVTGAHRTQAEQDTITYFQKEGVSFAFLNYMTYTNIPGTPFGVSMYSDERAQAQVTAAQQKADIVIVSMRWGTEYSPDANPQQQDIAQKLANYGADVVLGHGPHVLQPMQVVAASDGRQVPVWYSLGNFLNTQLQVEALIGGFAVMDIDTATKKISVTGFMPVYMHYEWSPAERAANNLLARRNLSMLPLDQAAEKLAVSQLGTTVEAQTVRVTEVLNKLSPVKILKASEF